MNNKINSIQKLDLVLNWFLNNQEKIQTGAMIGHIFELTIEQYPYLKDYTDWNSDLKKILDKLVSDNYIEFIPEKLLNRSDGFPPRRVNYDMYRITFDGEFFCLNGGYYANVEMGIRQKRSQNLKDFLLISGSWIASLAGAGLLYFEYVKLNHHNPYGLNFREISVIVSILLLLISITIILPKSNRK